MNRFFNIKKFLWVAIVSATTMTITGCKNPSNPWYDDTTAYDQRAQAWLFNEDESETQNNDFLPLNDEDLKPQFKEFSHQSSKKDLGEQGLPGAHEFRDPTSSLASIFHPVFFDTNKHHIHDHHLGNLGKVAKYLKKHPKTLIIIEGHCDERGAEAYNLALGTKRANNVRAQLIKAGVNPDQIHTISYGKEKPFAPGHTPADWAQNRRAHFRIHTQ